MKWLFHPDSCVCQPQSLESTKDKSEICWVRDGDGERIACFPPKWSCLPEYRTWTSYFPTSEDRNWLVWLLTRNPSTWSVSLGFGIYGIFGAKRAELSCGLWAPEWSALSKFALSGENSAWHIMSHQEMVAIRIRGIQVCGEVIIQVWLYYRDTSIFCLFLIHQIGQHSIFGEVGFLSTLLQFQPIEFYRLSLSISATLIESQTKWDKGHREKDDHSGHDAPISASGSLWRPLHTWLQYASNILTGSI